MGAPGAGDSAQTADAGPLLAEGGAPAAASAPVPLLASTAAGSERWSRKNDKTTSTASVSPGLSTTFYVLDTPQLPLLSLSGLERAAQAVGGGANLGTCSDTNTASITLRAPTGSFLLRARRECGYPVMRGDIAPDGMFILSPHGNHVLIVDTGAQASVMGPEHAHMLVRRGPPPAGLMLYGAGDAPLRVREVGELRFAFTAAAGLPGALSKQTIQMIRAQPGFRLGVIEARPAPEYRHQISELSVDEHCEIPELVVVDDAMYCGLQASVSIPPPVGSSLSFEHEDGLLIDCGPGYTLYDPRRLWPGPQVAGSDQTKSDMPRALTFTSGSSHFASTFSGEESSYPAGPASRPGAKPIERSSWTSPDDAASVRAVRFDNGASSRR